RVFANGSTPTTAMSVARATGMVSFPQGIGNVFGSFNMPNGLKPTTANTISNDWNDIKELGFYYGSNTMINGPTNQGYFCTVIPAASGALMQEFKLYTS